jgi:ubiquinone/menaquinone biosynthesis C-methylase UbiE
MSGPSDVYSHGHHPSVLRAHRWRTAANSAGYLLPRLHPGDELLDIGCGPGTITCDLASEVSPGHVTGVDRVADVISQARAEARRQRVEHVTFLVGDIYDLQFENESFDVVHAHQVLQHLSDPVAGLREMKRVCRPGGLVAVRDADYAAMTWHPDDVGLTRWLDLYHQVARSNGGEPDAGRRLRSWGRQAGFSRVEPSASVWCFADSESLLWWSESWAERLRESDFGRQARDQGLVDSSELESLAQDWRAWGTQADAWFTVMHGEILCTP